MRFRFTDGAGLTQRLIDKYRQTEYVHGKTEVCSPGKRCFPKWNGIREAMYRHLQSWHSSIIADNSEK